MTAPISLWRVDVEASAREGSAEIVEGGEARFGRGVVSDGESEHEGFEEYECGGMTREEARESATTFENERNSVREFARV